MMRHAVRLLMLGLALACTGAAHAQAPATWLFASDVHFNPLDDPRLVDRLAAAPVEQWDAIFAESVRPLSPHGQDTNAALLHLALAQMRAAVPDPAVVVIPGDFLVHAFHGRWTTAASDRSDAAFEAFADKTVAYLAVEFNAAYPRAQFVIALGNNDSTCGDYAAMPRSAFLAHFAQSWAPLVDRDGRAPDFVREFAVDGDYVADVPGGTRIVAVNSNPWSPVASDACDPGGTAATDGIAWFERAVAASPAGARTWAVMHIPPGFDAYSSLRANLPIPFYRPELEARVRAVRAADGKPLGLIVAGHLHNDGFRIVDRTPLMLVPSISPIHANNPAFFAVRIDAKTGAIADYHAFALDENGDTPAGAPPADFAPEYGFDSSYGVHGFTYASLEQLEAAIHDDQATRALQAAHYVAGSTAGAIDARTWHAYWCSNIAMDAEAFATCSATP